MLIPVLVRANYKIASSLTVTLEDLLGVNIPLLFPEVLILNRTPTTASLTVTAVRKSVYTNQTDPDFNGTVTTPLSLAFAIGNGQGQKLTGLDGSLVPPAYGVSNEVTLANSGPAAQAWVSLVIKGLIESSVQPDPLIVVNV